MNPRPVRFDALALADGTGVLASPGSLLVRFDDPRRPHAPTLLASGAPAEVDRHPEAANARTVPLPDAVLIPGLVNAHTHLDLTHIGPRPHDPGAANFVDWVDMIRAGRAHEDGAIAASVRLGVALSLRGGTVAVGDIGGAPRGNPTLTPWRTLRDSPLLGVSYLEFFAIGPGASERLPEFERLLDEGLAECPRDASAGVRLGLQPHAPNTVGLPAYRWAFEIARERGIPISTHLAETPEERLFVAEARGPQRALLERFNLWNESLLEHIGRGRHPVAHLADALPPDTSSHPVALAHVNDADDPALQTLARAGVHVVYCPRASTYFGAHHHFGPHRYREMLAAGIPVALGTDSVVNLHPWLKGAMHEGPGPGMSILDEMRLLHARDGTDPVTLLRMATFHGAAALGLDPALFTLGSSPDQGKAPPRPLAGVLAVRLDPEGEGDAKWGGEGTRGGTGRGLGGGALVRLLRSESRPVLLSDRIYSDPAA